MSKLDELISVLCPDGVPYKYLSECCSLEKGKTPIQKAIPGEYPLVVTTAERKTSNDEVILNINIGEIGRLL